MNRTKKVIIILAVCMIVISSYMTAVNAASVSAMLKADEKYKSTDFLPRTVSTIYYYFTVGETSEHAVQFIISKHSSMSLSTYEIVKDFTFLPGSSVRSSLTVANGNYLCVTMYGNGTASPKNGCIAGALLYDDTGLQYTISEEIEAINNALDKE